MTLDYCATSRASEPTTPGDTLRISWIAAMLPVER
jgi:hypothetical protein